MAAAPELIECGVATLSLPGETQSGDLHLVKRTGSGALVAVVDGLGHGAEAAAAARAAVAALERHAGESVMPLVQSCHRAVAGTRGVVMSLAWFSGGADAAMTWIGVGNVEGVLLYSERAAGRARHTLVTRGGIIGSDLPRLWAEVVAVTPGDTLIFATDGVEQGFAEGLPRDAPPQQLADQILTRHRKGTDDALVLVARYTGGARDGT